jgi:hypothetical protein
MTNGEKILDELLERFGPGQRARYAQTRAIEEGYNPPVSADPLGLIIQIGEAMREHLDQYKL